MKTHLTHNLVSIEDITFRGLSKILTFKDTYFATDIIDRLHTSMLLDTALQ